MDKKLKKALILESRPAEAHESMGTQYSEDSAVFYLEMLFRIVVQNRDRILTFWNSGIVLKLRNITFRPCYFSMMRIDEKYGF